MEFVRRTWPWAAAILTGIGLAAGFAPWNQEWAAWVGLGPLLAAILFRGENVSRKPERRWLGDLLLGYVAGIVYIAGAFHWLGSLGQLMGNWALAGLPLLLALYMGLYAAFWGWFVGAVSRGLARWRPVAERPLVMLHSRHNLALAFLAAAAWVAGEWVRGVLFTGWGWNDLGVILHRELPLIQIVEFTGVGGLSFLLVLANVILVLTVRRFALEVQQRGKLRPHYDFTVTMALIVGTFGFGVQRLLHPAPVRLLPFAAVQTNIPQDVRWSGEAEANAETYAILTSLTQVALVSKPALVIWPEAATPDDLFHPDTIAAIKSLGALGDFNLLFGTVLNENGSYNAAALVQRDTGALSIYRKQHLVPFGEYIPLRKSFPLFAMIAGGMITGDFDSGHDLAPLQLADADVALAPLICFEDTLGELTRQPVLRGADLLVNLTNDGWFLHSAGAQQHFANAVFRTIETRRPMIRAANTGLTCFIDQTGRVTQSLVGSDGQPFVRGVLSGKVGIPVRQPGPPVLTFYTQHGELFSHLMLAVTASALVVMFRPRHRAA